MLHKAKTMKGYTLHGRDGEPGVVKESSFDDRHWTIRYLVADTQKWLTGRQVLISPYAMSAVNGEEQHIAIDLTRQQIETSPSLGSDKPVSRQFEAAHFEHYGYPLYWIGPSTWGFHPYWFPRSGSSASAGASRRSSSICCANPSRSHRSTRKPPC